MAVLATDAAAYPEFVRNGYFSCTSCHVSPGGGSTLTDYGRSFAGEKVATWARPGEEKLVPTPEWFLLGANVRNVQTNVETSRAKEGRWIAMQRDVDVCLKLGPTHTCATAGLKGEEKDEFGLRKGYVRGDVGESFIVRAGRFFPRFGLMIANHTSPVRRGLGFDAGSETDQVEGTFVSEKLEITAYRDFGKPVRFPGDDKDANEAVEKATGGTVAVALGDKSRAGASYRRQQDTHTSGAFTAVGLSETTFVLAEIDQRRIKDLRAAASHLKVGHEVTRGVVPYLLHEADVADLRDGETRKDTYGLGLQWFPRPHFEIDAFYGHMLLRRDFSYASAGYLILHFYL